MPLLVHSARFSRLVSCPPLALGSRLLERTPIVASLILVCHSPLLLDLFPFGPPLLPSPHHAALFYSPRPASPWSRIFLCFEVCPFYLCRSLSSLLASSAYTLSSFLYTFVSCIGKLQVLGEQTRPLQQPSCAASTDWYRPHTPSATSRLALFSTFPSMRYRANSRPAASPL